MFNIQKELNSKYELRAWGGTSSCDCQNTLYYVMLELQIQAQSHTHQLRCNRSKRKKERKKKTSLKSVPTQTSGSQTPEILKLRVNHVCFIWSARTLAVLTAYDVASAVINSSAREVSLTRRCEGVIQKKRSIMLWSIAPGKRGNVFGSLVWMTPCVEVGWGSERGWRGGVLRLGCKGGDHPGSPSGHKELRDFFLHTP